MSAARSTTNPRALLIRNSEGFIRRKAASSISLQAAGMSGTCTEKASDAASGSSNGTLRAARSRSGSGYATTA
jgi:hypothetical protein